MARPKLYTKNTKELASRARANKKNNEYVSFTGLAVPKAGPDRDEWVADVDSNNRHDIRSTFGIPYALIDAATLIVGNDGQTLIRVANVFAKIGDGVAWSTPAGVSILNKVERNTVDVDGFLELLKDSAES